MTRIGPPLLERPAEAAHLGCSPDCGVVRERSASWERARRTAARAFPGLVWCAAPVWAPDESPVAVSEIRDIARDVELLLPSRTWIASADGLEADALIVLAGERANVWWDVVSADAVTMKPERDETYLRISFSKLARFATLQEMVIGAAGAADPSRTSAAVGTADDRSVRIESFAGVADTRLRDFVRAVHSVLKKHDIASLDPAFLSAPIDDPDGRARAQLGHAPTLWTLLFSREPADHETFVELR